MADARSFIDELDASLKAVQNAMKAGNYKFATGDLPFMEILDRYHEALIPFKYLLLLINETHMKGLQI
jgi:hypothetical protein